MATQRQPLTYYLELDYPYTVVPDDGSFFIEFPDLPGCMTQVEDASEIASAAEEIRTLWIEGEYEDGHDIPEPVTKTYSGKFVTRVPKTLHRDLAESAKREGMSLNSYVNYLLAERNMASRIERKLNDVHSPSLDPTMVVRMDEVKPVTHFDRTAYRPNTSSERLARSRFTVVHRKEATG